MARKPKYVKCKIEECDANAHRSGCGSRGYCSNHYYRLWKHGDPLAGRTRQGAPIGFLRANVGYGEDDCLRWPFGLANKGYGLICIDGKNTQASRYMCLLAHGEPPTPSHQAAHSCGNGHLGCVNPKHLRWATPTENARDRAEHETTYKLSIDEVLAIRDDRRKLREIAAQYDVSISLISRIRLRKIFGYVCRPTSLKQGEAA